MAKMELSVQEKHLLHQAYWGSLSCMRVTGNVTGQGKSMLLAVNPFIQKYYKTEEEKREAVVRNASEFVNTHQTMFGLLVGIVCAMEKERAEKGNLDASSITGLKASLMGPLAGIGDSFFFNCYRLIVASVAIGLSANGNLLGPLFFFLFYGVGLLLIKYVLLVQGYKNGIALVDKASEQGLIPLLMDACGAMGALMIGALVASNVKVTIALAPVINGAEISIQNVLDTVMPGLMSLVVFFICMKLVRKGVSPVKLIFSIMGICLVLAFLGVF